MDQLPILRMGSEGEDVVTLQRFLISQGFDLGEMGADGDFGRRTQEAVRQFQARAGIDVDSVVGPKTYEAILQVAQAVQPVPRANPDRVPQPAGQGLQPGGAVGQQQRQNFDQRFGQPGPMPMAGGMPQVASPAPFSRPGTGPNPAMAAPVGGVSSGPLPPVTAPQIGQGGLGQQMPMVPPQMPQPGPMPMAGGPVGVPSMAPMPQPGQAPMKPQMGTRFPGDPGMGAPANPFGPNAGRPPDASQLSPMQPPPQQPQLGTRPSPAAQFGQPGPMPMAGGPVGVPSMAPMPQPGQAPPQPLQQGGQVRQQQMENFDARFGQLPPPPRVQPTAAQLSPPPPQSNTWPVAEPGGPRQVPTTSTPPPQGADFWLRNGTSPAEMNRGMHFRNMPAGQMPSTPDAMLQPPPTGEPPRQVPASNIPPNAFSGKPQLGPINMGGGPPPGFGQGQQQTSTPEEMSRVSPTLGMLMGQGLDPAMAERILGELIRMVGAQQQPGV